MGEVVCISGGRWFVLGGEVVCIRWGEVVCIRGGR